MTADHDDTIRLQADGIVALVEDGDTDAAAFRRVFRDYREVLCWRSGEDAIDALVSDAPAIDQISLLVVDMGLPGIDGPGVIRHVRALPGGDGPAIIALSGRTDHALIDRAFDAGADDYFVKPPSLEALRVLVCELVAATNDALAQRR